MYPFAFRNSRRISFSCRSSSSSSSSRSSNSSSSSSSSGSDSDAGRRCMISSHLINVYGCIHIKVAGGRSCTATASSSGRSPCASALRNSSISSSSDRGSDSDAGRRCMVHLILLLLFNTIPFISIIADTDNIWALVTKEASCYSPLEYPGLSLPLRTTMYNQRRRCMMVHLILLLLFNTIPFISIIADTDNILALVTTDSPYYPAPEYPGLSLPLLTTM